MFLKSLILLGGGPGRRLCMPTHNSTSDGPWRTLKFKLRRIRHDYHNVLVLGDKRKLLSISEELLMNRKTKKSRAFWEIFSKRCKGHANLFHPCEMAVVLRAFDIHNIDTGIYVSFSAGLVCGHHSNLRGNVPNIDAFGGLSIVTLLDIFSRRLKKNSYNEVFKIISNQIPMRMFQFSVKDLISVLNSYIQAGIIDMNSCKRSVQKISKSMGTLDVKCLSLLSKVLSEHKYRDLEFFSLMAERAMEIKSDFDNKTIYTFLKGYMMQSIECGDLLKGLSSSLVDFLPEYNEKILKEIQEMIILNIEDENDENRKDILIKITKYLKSENSSF